MKHFSEYIDEFDDDLKPLKEDECINLVVDDDLLSHAKVTGYNFDQTTVDDKGKTIPVNPKKIPTKAIQINLVANGLPIEIYLDAMSKKWDSDFNYNGQNGKLSPDQFAQFFNSEFYRRLVDLVARKWPLSDQMYNELYQGIIGKEMQINGCQTLGEEDDQKIHNDGHAKRKDLANKDTSGDGERDYTSSGRKIVNFNDQGMNNASGEFYCWPKPGKEFNWSQWKDWKKIRPLTKIRFKYGQYYYTTSVGVVDEYKHRGYRGANIDLKPPLQWLTPDECDKVTKLSLFRKFTRACVERISKYLDMDTDEIYSKMNNKDKITKDEIEKTKSMIRKTLNAVVRPMKADDFSWKDAKPKKDVDECDAGGAVGPAPSGDAGAPAAEVAASKGTSTTDVLGKCDHCKDGYLGPHCYHVPKNILAYMPFGPNKKKKGKNPYVARRKMIVAEVELDRKTILNVHKVPEEKIVEFIKKNYNLQQASIKLVGIFYNSATKTAFIKFKNGRITQYVSAEFDQKKFVVVDNKTYSPDEAHEEFKKILHMPGNNPDNVGSDSEELWIIWGSVR